MPKEDQIEMEGIVLETLPNTMFRVQLDNGLRYHCPYFWAYAQELVYEFPKVTGLPLQISPYDLSQRSYHLSWKTA